MGYQKSFWQRDFFTQEAQRVLELHCYPKQALKMQKTLVLKSAGNLQITPSGSASADDSMQ